MTKFSGTNADREIFIFPVQLTTCRTGNLTRLIYTLAICVTYIALHTYTTTSETRIGIGPRHVCVGREANGIATCLAKPRCALFRRCSVRNMFLQRVYDELRTRPGEAFQQTLTPSIFPLFSVRYRLRYINKINTNSPRLPLKSALSKNVVAFTWRV